MNSQVTMINLTKQYTKLAELYYQNKARLKINDECSHDKINIGLCKFYLNTLKKLVHDSEKLGIKVNDFINIEKEFKELSALEKKLMN